MTHRLELTDVSVREGAQLPGRSYTVEQKVEAVQTIARLDPTAIEVGFPPTGEVDQESFHKLSDLNVPTVALCRARPSDIELAAEVGADVANVFIPISERQLEHVLGKSRERATTLAIEAAELAADHGLNVRVSLMDAFRTPSAAVADVLNSLPVEYVTLADTVGAATPMEVESFLTALADEECDLSTLAVHFHDDLGLATANTLTAARSGIEAADVSINGIGERAGNAPLEEIVASRVLAGNAVGIDYEELVPISRVVADTLGEPVAEDKALLGSRPTTHEAGIHTAAMLTDPGTFEPFDPERFGGERSLVVGQGSGRRTVAAMFEAVGEPVTDERIEAVLERLDDDNRLSVDEAKRTVQAVAEEVQA